MRVTFLIDGFNLYHSILDNQEDTGISTKWLDINSLMKSYLHPIPGKVELEEIYFFTALRNFIRSKNPRTVKRHERYIKILEDTGVKVVLGRFKNSSSFCKKCKKNNITHEEKETDVNIAVTLIELAYLDKADVFVIVSGDTDLVPGIDVVKRQFPNKRVFVIYPYKRKNDDFKSRTDGHFQIKPDTYSKHQLPNPYKIGNNEYKKPDHW